MTELEVTHIRRYIAYRIDEYLCNGEVKGDSISYRHMMDALIYPSIESQIELLRLCPECKQHFIDDLNSIKALRVTLVESSNEEDLR